MGLFQHAFRSPRPVPFSYGLPSLCLPGLEDNLDSYLLRGPSAASPVCFVKNHVLHTL